MGAPTSKNDIANLALRHLKQSPVASIDPPDSSSKAAKSAAAFYDQARRTVLEEHTWNFAKKRTQISESSTTPAFGYDKQYPQPDGFIAVARIGTYEDEDNYDLGLDDDDVPVIQCDLTSPINLVWIKDVTTVSRFSPLFIEALSYKLAELMAYDLAGSKTLGERMSQKYEIALSKARTRDGQQRPPKRRQQSKILNARRNMGRAAESHKNWGDS